MATITHDLNVPIGESISKCKEEIRNILYRLKAFYEPCDLDTARGFTEDLIQGLNKVFDDFIVEAFADGANTNSNNDKNHQREAALSSSIPIKRKSSDDPEIEVKQESVNETAITLDIQTKSFDISVNSVNESGSLDDRVVCEKQSEKVQRKTETNPSTKCEVCKTEFRSLFELVYHRRIHLDDLNHFCRMCLQSFSSNFYRNLHEEQCKYRRYECYICGMSHLSLVGLQTHFRVHTEMISFRIGHAIEKYSENSEKCKSATNR